MASPTPDPTLSAEVPPMANPPATLDQVAANHADRARAAVGGAAAAGAQPQAAPRRRARPGRGDRLHRAARFEPPADLEFEYTPPTSQSVPNSNLPLTIGLMISIVASFVIFFISIAASSGPTDPIMPAFWRALGALAVLMTLSFAASWFMPQPEDHRQLLDQLDAQDRALGKYQTPSAPRQREETSTFSSMPAYDLEDEFEMGTNLDVTVQDDDFGEDDELLTAQPQDDDFFDDEDDDLIPSSSNQQADLAGFGTGQ